MTSHTNTHTHTLAYISRRFVDAAVVAGPAERVDRLQFLQNRLPIQIAQRRPALDVVQRFNRFAGGALRFEAGQQTVDVIPVVHFAGTARGYGVGLASCIFTVALLGGDRRRPAALSLTRTDWPAPATSAAHR